MRTVVTNTMNALISVGFVLCRQRPAKNRIVGSGAIRSCTSRRPFTNGRVLTNSDPRRLPMLRAVATVQAATVGTAKNRRPQPTHSMTGSGLRARTIPPISQTAVSTASAPTRQVSSRRRLSCHEQYPSATWRPSRSDWETAVAIRRNASARGTTCSGSQWPSCRTAGRQPNAAEGNMRFFRKRLIAARTSSGVGLICGRFLRRDVAFVFGVAHWWVETLRFSSAGWLRVRRVVGSASCWPARHGISRADRGTRRSLATPIVRQPRDKCGWPAPSSAPREPSDSRPFTT